MTKDNSLYTALLKTIKEWTKKQDKNVHIQFILGTLDRVKYDYYNSILGNVHTLNTFIKMLKGSKVDFGDDGSILMIRDIPKSKISKKKL